MKDKKVQEAIDTARRLHQGQYRKGTKDQVPYITHPIAVMELVMKYTDDEDKLIAAVLHDTVEDCGYTFEEMEEKFGKPVADLVRELTEDMALKKKDAKDTWRQRKEKYLAHLQTATPAALLICWADKVHNLKSMAIGFKELGREEFWSRFNAKATDSAWYYGEIREIFRQKLEAGPLREFEGALNEVSAIFDTGNPTDTKPFVAFVMNDSDNTYTLLLVNPTDKNYPLVRGFTGAFMTVDDDLLETSKSVGDLGALPPKSSLKIESSDQDGLEFVIWYHLDLCEEGVAGPLHGWFDLPKYGRGYEPKNLPILGIQGMRIDLSPCDKKNVDEDVASVTTMDSRLWKSGQAE